MRHGLCQYVLPVFRKTTTITMYTNFAPELPMSDEHFDLRAKVLIAEDDTIVALDLQGMVTRLGYDVVQIVDNGQNATASAKRFLPDIALVDMGLSGTPDAIDIAREIHGALDIPIVFCVGTPDISSLARAKDLDYATYLLKPINPDSLSTTLDTVLYKYKLERRVKQAEEKFRQLAQTCELLQFFLDRDSAVNWTWSPLAGIVTGRGSMTQSLKGKLAESLAKMSPEAAVPERVNFLLPDREGGWAVVGYRAHDGDKLEGIVIPLSRIPE